MPWLLVTGGALFATLLIAAGFGPTAYRLGKIDLERRRERRKARKSRQNA